jgi:hypothetical protein
MIKININNSKNPVIKLLMTGNVGSALSSKN